MSKANLSRKLLAAALAASFAGSAGAAMAQDAAAKWTQLQQGARLSAICRGTPLDSDREAWRAIGPKLDAAVGHEIGGGERLTLIETAKTDARVLVEKKGCDSEDAAALLKEYDAAVGG